MENRNLYDVFAEMFPQYRDRVADRGQTEGHEIRIALEDHVILIFEYHDPDYWKLETAKSYVDFKSFEGRLEEMKRRARGEENN